MKAYTAQEKVDINQAAITMALSFVDVIKNPEALKNAAKELVDANTMSAEKRAELEEAERTIEYAKEVTDKLNSFRELQSVEIQKITDEFNSRQMSIKNSEEELQKRIKEFNSDIALKTNAAQQLKNSAEIRHKEADARENNLKLSEAKVVENNIKLRKEEIVLEQKRILLQDVEAKLQARKNKLIEATRED